MRKLLATVTAGIVLACVACTRPRPAAPPVQPEGATEPSEQIEDAAEPDKLVELAV